MQTERNIQSFLQNANMNTVERGIKESGANVSRFTLLKLKKGDFNVQYRSIKAVSDYIDSIFGDE